MDIKDYMQTLGRQARAAQGQGARPRQRPMVGGRRLHQFAQVAPGLLQVGQHLGELVGIANRLTPRRGSS